MNVKHICIEYQNIKIPAVLWGQPSSKMLIAVHGNFSNKEDTVITMAAEKAVQKGYQALSFDLPMHGERAKEAYECTHWNCISDLKAVFDFAQSLASDISLFACSMGAYFSLLAYQYFSIKQSLFLSPVVNMERLVDNMMAGFQVSKARLEKEGHISLPTGQALDWDYYRYVKENPISFDWNMPTSILYGSDDEITEWNELAAFSSKNKATIEVLEHGAHFFHTEEQLRVFNAWINKNLF